MDKTIERIAQLCAEMKPEDQAKCSGSWKT